jgi:hypothetical protein
MGLACPRTWIRITKDGRRALADEIELLEQLVQRIEAHNNPLVDGKESVTK